MAVIRGIVLVAHPVHVFTRRFAPIIRAAIIKTRIKRRAVSVLRASAPVCKAAHLSAPIVPAIIIIRRVAISLVSKVTALVLNMVSKKVAISPVSKAIVPVLSTDSRRVATSPVSKRVAISLVSKGGYQPRGGYQSRQGGYQPRQQGYNPNYGGKPYGAPYGNPYKKKQHGPYDPNAKYSMKKRIEYKEEHYDPTEPIRLNKFLANAGVCSRREADEFIQAGVVKVNGEVVTELGTKVLRTDTVLFHDAPVTPEKKVYVLLNKPKDYVTTSDDPQQRKTVMDLVKGACPERIYPVGRLDRNTTGVLLLTNDGDLASKLTHPKFLKKKIYHVHLDKNVTAHDMEQIANGIMLEDGEIKADAIEYADEKDKKSVGIEIHSGKNRIVRRIFESLGYKVTKLDRVQFAGLTKKNVRRGDWRYLTEEEVDRLRMGAYE